VRSVTLTLDRDAGAPRRARRALEEAAGDLPPAPLDTARLLLSELVTNSVRYAEGPRMEVEVARDGDELTVRVRDDGTGVPPDREVAMPAPDAGSGRGLPLVAALAARWGVRREPTAEVWFTLEVPPGGGPEMPEVR
jgi:anti-sigma regulatory factor (Ser/Thr protein kinase)